MGNCERIAYTFVIGLCIFVVGAGHASDTASIAEILKMNHEAVRGVGNSSPIRSTEKELRIVEDGNTLTARYRAADNGTVRIDVFHSGQRVFSEGKDMSGVWEWPGDQESPSSVTHDGVAALEHGVEFNLFTLAELRARGHHIELVKTTSVRGETYFVLLLTLKDGFKTYRYVNRRTGLVDVSRDFRAFHPGVDGTKRTLETRNDRFQTTGGIVSATRSRTLDVEAGTEISTIEILESRYNLPLDELDIERTYLPQASSRID